MLPDLLSGHAGAPLTVTIDGTHVIKGPKAVLVSNNPYTVTGLTQAGRRPRLDEGRLGVLAVRVDGPVKLGVVSRTATSVIVEADTPRIPVGIDGEAVWLPTPVRCTIRPKALRVRLPAPRQ
jgi:diacylglycerol kinase family enzyme